MSLWFVVPAHGRTRLTQICLRQLRRTCDALTENGIEATAVVIADAENLDALQPNREFGFATVRRDNLFLSRRFNDGIQMACDPNINPRPAWYVVPIGSDDWIDYRLLLDLPPQTVVYGFQRMCFVSENGREMLTKRLDYLGGSGIRVYPRHVLKRLGFRPADEDRQRGCDTSILNNLRKASPYLRVIHPSLDPRQIVDWKSHGQQLNSLLDLSRHRTDASDDPFVALADIYPAEALDEMRSHYGIRESVHA